MCASYLLLRAMFILAALEQLSADCPKSCVCHVHGEVHCTFRYLTAIPDHFPPAVERINLGYNSITGLRENDLLGLDKLELLMLHSNTIHNIEDKTFQDLKSLQVLKVSHNKVKEINKETFKGLGSLLRLHMDHNSIEFINPEAFYGLTRLLLVNLEGNHLQQLHPDTFITLRHNVFKVSSVRTIHLSDNFLTSLPANIFTGCSQLENVFLHGNPWMCDCHMEWFVDWAQKKTGVLKCKRDRRYPRGQLCPVCENSTSHRNSSLALLQSDAFTCVKPWITPHLKHKNISLDEGDYTPVSPKDFIAPLGSIQIHLTDELHNDASLTCTVQRPSAFENLSQTIEEEEGNNVTALTTGIITYLVCNIDNDHIKQLWQVLATYSNLPLKLERGIMLARAPEMVYRYYQIKDEEAAIMTKIEAEIKASPAWLLQGEVSLQLDRATTTQSTLHIKYKSVVNLRMENTPLKKDRYSWTMIKRNNQTKTEHTVIKGGVAHLSCQIQGEPKPLMEWILPDGSKVRAPFSSEDRRIVITSEGKLTLRSADFSDTGLYWCIATNYLDADILTFRVTVLSPDVEETEVNGLQLSKSIGENLILDCSSSGSPKPSLWWVLPDLSVLYESKENRNMFDNGTLIIQSLTERDRGFYRCLVANHLGVDMIVSQVTLSEMKHGEAAGLDNEGSGTVTLDSSLAVDTVNFGENLSSSLAERTGQESRTITSDRPYPKPRLQDRANFDDRFGQRRRGFARNKHIWSSRVFGKTYTKVDPQKFAEYFKKAHSGSRLRDSTESKGITQGNPHATFSGDETGSGGGHENHLTVVPSIENPTAKPISTIPKSGKQIVDIENTFGYDDRGSSPLLENYAQSDSTPVNTMFTHLPNSAETEFSNLEKTSSLPFNIQPVTAQFAITQSGQETLSGSWGELLSETETSTGAALSFTTDPNVAPVRDRMEPVELVIHTDPESQTTFTAVTTTEKQLDEITLHSTQTIKSPQLSAGSTIISQQQIHIIPHKNGRGKGGRRNIYGRRRIIKPNRITDIKSFLNRLKPPPIKKEENTSLPFRIQQTTECDCDEDKKTVKANVHRLTPTTLVHSSETEIPVTMKATISPLSQTKYTSHDHPENTRTHLLLTTTKSPSQNTTTTSTTASTFIRQRMQWRRPFVGRENVKGRLRRPPTPTRQTTTAQITTVNPTTTIATPTTSVTSPESESPSSGSSIDIQSKGDHSYGEISSADFESTTLGPSFQYRTTTSSSSFTRVSTTADSPRDLQTLPSPPTVNPHSVKDEDADSSSGSGELPDDWLVARHRPAATGRRPGPRRRPFGAKVPFEQPAVAKPAPATTTLFSTTEVTTIETTVESSIQPKKENSFDQSFTESELYDEFEQTSGSSSLHTTTETPIFTSASYESYTSLIPTTKIRSRTTQTAIYSNNKHVTEKQNEGNHHESSAKRIQPTLQSNGVISSNEKEIIFGTDKIHAVGQKHVSSTPLNNNLHIPTMNPPYFDKQVTTAVTPQLAFTTKATSRKPRIIGGNAASFTVLSNSDAFLPCEAIGNPQPVITWRRFSSGSESALTIKGRMGKFEVSTNGTLSILNANMKDRGQYLCLAENHHGSDKLLVTLSVVAYPSRILEPKIREMKSHSGNTVEMKCKVEGRPAPVISWILANRTQVRGQNTNKGKVFVSFEGTLIIKNVSVFDRGYYKCIASNPAGADTATVRLQVVADPPGITEEKRQQLKAGLLQTLWLPCTGYGNPQPTIHWVIRDGSVVRSDRHERRISVFENGTLLIKDVTLSDTGKYECIATSSTGSERRVVILNVETQQYAPQIVGTFEHMRELSFGDQLRLNCSATGEPKPIIIWTLPSKTEVDYWHRLGSRVWVLDNGTLIINSVSDKDAGHYICEARSTIGNDVRIMRVVISMKPAKIEPKLLGTKQIPYGNDLKVDCKASGAPKPEITWGLPDGTVVNSALQSDGTHGGRRARRYILFENGTLYVNQVELSEEGDYTCYAENQVGKDQMHVHITVVTAAPRIHSPSQTHFQVKPGASIRFDCEAFGEPKPRILWMLPTNDVIAASSDRYLMHVNGSLDIRDVVLIDAGEYICMARNSRGEDRKVYRLDINGNSPVINGYLQNRTVIKDFAPKHSRKLIDCKAEGDPTPTVTWIMPDNIFLKAPYFGSRINVYHNGTLEIRNVRPTDTAEFICLARNDGGEAALVVQLEITSMHRRPIFRNPFNERITSRIGKTTILNCSADGQPIPKIVWTFPNGTLLNSGSTHGSRYQVENDGTLVITNSQKEDSGKYRCGAKNFLGYIEKLIILDIGQKPYILTRPKGIIRSISGETLFLHCLSDGSPRPRIYWTIPGGHTLTRPQVLGRYQLMGNGTLIVQDAVLHDRGPYVCRARNDAGEAMLTVPVSIIAYPPRITAGPSSVVRGITGIPIQLNCAATGIPKPEITWELPDQSRLSAAEQGHPLGSEILHPQGTLIIQRPRASDSGQYKCIAKNNLGADSKITSVYVL